MTTQVSTVVRLVRCPGCRKVLIEPSDFSLYECGGCGTVLQAKNRRQETGCSESSAQEAYSVERSQQGSPSEEKDAGRSNDGSTRPPSLESSPDKDSLSCHDDSSKDLGSPSSLVQGTCPQSEDITLEVLESLEQDNLLGQKSEGYDSKSQDENGEWSGSSSDEIPSSGELKVDVPEATEYVGCGQGEDNDFLDDIPSLPELEDEEIALPQDNEDKGTIDQNYALPQNDDKNLISDSEHVAHETNNVPQSAEHIPKVDDEADGMHAHGSSIGEKKMNGTAHDTVVTSQRSLNESLASFYLTCPDDDPLDHSPPRRAARNYGRVSSIATLGSSSLADLSTVLHIKNGSAANYPPANSYYAYDGSESSYDGTDDQIRVYAPSRNHREAEYSSPEEKDEFLVNHKWERNFWAASSSHRAGKGCHRGPDKSAEVNGYTGGNSLRPNKQRDVSRLRPAPRDPVSSLRAGYRHNLLPPRPGFSSSDKGSYSEAEKMELLRRVYQLKDELNRVQFPKVHKRIPPGVMEGKFNPFHYDHLMPEREIYSGLNHHNPYHLRRDLGRGCAEGCSISRPAFSGEAVHYRHRLGCSCLHCHPQDWHFSAQLPCKNSCCDHNFIPSALSPQHYTSSELSLWGSETTKSGNQKHDEMKRLRLKEKYNTAKKHLLPVASGAPIVGCYHCFELLQLPADFLLFKRRYHQLRCNTCRKILKFSLLNGTSLVPYRPDASAPPPSVADDYDDAARSRNVEPMSHSSSCQHVEAMSYSDNGQSFCRSCSTEGEAASVMSSTVKQVGRNSYNRKMSSGSSSTPVEDKNGKSIMREDQSKNGRKIVELVGPSRTWEIEEVLSNSPLHQLMGYSSPSQVMTK